MLLSEGWGQAELLACFCGLAPGTWPWLDAFPTTELKGPLSPLPPPQLMVTRPHCGPGYSGSYRGSRLCEEVTPDPGALPTFQEKLAHGTVTGQLA